MGRIAENIEYKRFLDWCKKNKNDLANRASEIAENRDNSNRTGHLYRGYLAAVHFLSEYPSVHEWLKKQRLSSRQPVNVNEMTFSKPWSEFMRRESKKHAVLRNILPKQYGGETTSGGGGAYPFKVALRLAAEFVPLSDEGEASLPAKYRMVRKKEFDRDYPEVNRLKKRYGFRCQVCQNTISLGGGKFYSEAHHLRPLGRQHKGPADIANVVILCPQHHAEFDFFLFAILDYKGKSRRLEHMLRDLGTHENRLLTNHKIGPEFVDYVTEQYLTRYDRLEGEA